jgi:ribosome-associated protein
MAPAPLPFTRLGNGSDHDIIRRPDVSSRAPEYRRESLQGQELQAFIVDKIDDMKGRDIITLDVRGQSSITDTMIVCSGNSSRHVSAIAHNLASEARHAGLDLLSVEGQLTGEWVLVDLGSVIVHVMQDEYRDFYQLEKLWSGAAQVNAQ